MIDDVGEVQLRVSSLQATVQGGLDSTLRLDVVHLFTEEIGIASEVVGRCERNCVDTVLDREHAGRREPRDSLCERTNERAELRSPAARD